MSSKSAGWVSYTGTNSGDAPTDMTSVNVYVEINAQSGGFYWSVNPSYNVLQALASTNDIDTLVFDLSKVGQHQGQIQGLDWQDNGDKDTDWIEVPSSWPSDSYTATASGGGTRTLTLKSGITNNTYDFTLKIKYKYQGTWYNCSLDPELDIGMT